MKMGGSDKKRIREEQDLSPPEESWRQKQGRLMEFEAGMAFHTPENAGAGNENLPEFCSLSNEYSMLLKDPWSWEDSTGFGIRSLAAVRKQSCILDYLHDSAVDNRCEKDFAEQHKVQEEEDCLRGSLFEATDDQLWRPQSPLQDTEALFPLDSMGSHDCTTLLQDESIVQGAASYFRIWEQDDGHKDANIHEDGIGFVCGSGISDWIRRAPSNQSEFSESVEFESSMFSL